MSNVKNLEVGVTRAMIAYLKESGVSDAAAASRVQAKLPEAIAFVNEQLDAEPSGMGENIVAAFGKLKTWTLTNV